MQRQIVYVHCECGRLVQLGLADSKAADPSGLLESKGGRFYGGACPSCKAQMSYTYFPAVENQPRIITPKG